MGEVVMDEKFVRRAEGFVEGELDPVVGGTPKEPAE
jgi:hypothetical protein